MLRTILIGFSILFLLLVVACVFLYLKIRLSLRELEARNVQELRLLQPRIRKGEGDFEKHIF
jgi:hypothetical protein